MAWLISTQSGTWRTSSKLRSFSRKRLSWSSTPWSASRFAASAAARNAVWSAAIPSDVMALASAASLSLSAPCLALISTSNC